jgi:hypothetical protein
MLDVLHEAYPILIAGAVALTMAGYYVISEIVSWFACRRNERLTKWQRRQLLDGEPPAFPVLPPR